MQTAAEEALSPEAVSGTGLLPPDAAGRGYLPPSPGQQRPPEQQQSLIQHSLHMDPNPNPFSGARQFIPYIQPQANPFPRLASAARQLHKLHPIPPYRAPVHMESCSATSPTGQSGEPFGSTCTWSPLPGLRDDGDRRGPTGLCTRKLNVKQSTLRLALRHKMWRKKRPQGRTRHHGLCHIL